MTSMAYRQVNPAELEGDELRRWYLRTPDKIDSERLQKEQARRDAFFVVGRVEEVRYLRPPAPARPARRPGLPIRRARREKWAREEAFSEATHRCRKAAPTFRGCPHR